MLPPKAQTNIDHMDVLQFFDIDHLFPELLAGLFPFCAKELIPEGGEVFNLTCTSALTVHSRLYTRQTGKGAGRSMAVPLMSDYKQGEPSHELRSSVIASWSVGRAFTILILQSSTSRPLRRYTTDAQALYYGVQAPICTLVLRSPYH